MKLGYNTNGFAHHRLCDTLPILAELGYEAVAITIERDHLDPPNQRGVDACLRSLTPIVESSGLRPTIETGARFILDPWRKHQPTLLSASNHDAGVRIDFLKAAIDVANGLDTDSVSLWSGAPDDGADETALWTRLSRRLSDVLDHAAAQNVRLSFEPEPGMFVDTMERLDELIRRLDGHHMLGLTLDIGHVMCLDDGRIEVHLERWGERLWNVHIEDMRCGLHEHLMFGEGDVDFPRVFRALRTIA